MAKHETDASQYLPQGAAAALLTARISNIDDGWFDEEDPDDPDEPFPFSFVYTPAGAEDHTLPEFRPLLLPSNISSNERAELCLDTLASKEMALRQGQANDALQAIRLGIAEKSFRFRNQLRPANSKGAKTRAWTLINNAGKKLQQHRLIYLRARQAMITLGASQALLETYKELSNSDMNTSTAVQHSNARKQRNAELSWIWRTPGVFAGDEDTLVMEC